MMKRRLVLNIKIDYDELMKAKGVEVTENPFCSKQEKEVMSNLTNGLMKDIEQMKRIEYVIEEEVEETNTIFKTSNKMGSCCALVLERKNDCEQIEKKL